MRDKLINLDDINNILKWHNEIPIHQIAIKLGYELYDVTRELRKRGKIRDVLPCELNYILENKDRVALEDLRKELGLSTTQFSQLCKRYNIGKKMKSIDEYTNEEIILKIKYLLEEKLNFTIDDILVSKLNEKTIIDANGYYLIKYSNNRKKEHKVYKYFSALAYLFHLAYPNKFRPYQFNHTSDTKEYFTPKIYLGELTIIMEDKMKLNLDNIETLAMCNGFLKKSDLEFYGLGKKLYIELFGNKKEMIRQLLVHLNKKNTKTYQSSQKLSDSLLAEGIDIKRCYCPWCDNSEIEIHHIYPKKMSSIVNFDINSNYNLIPLCKEHHSMVKNMGVDTLDLKNKDEWRMKVINYLDDCKDKINEN